MKRTRLWIASVAFATAMGLASAGAQDQGTARSTAPASPAPDQIQATAARFRQFSGTPIDVDYRAASLREVLRQLSDIGGVNLVIDASVPPAAAIDLKLTQVPWDQVMDVVLKTGALTYQMDGTVIRVMTRDARRKELEDEAHQKRASQQAPDLETMHHKLNYAQAAEVKRLLDAALLSDRGSVEVDERSNMLIIRDVRAVLDQMRPVLTEVDQPEPQVEIEARIVQANRDTARALGVMWGFNGRVAPELGNTTGLAFPNRGSVSGRVTQQGNVTQGPNDPRATDIERTGTGINLGVPGATSAIGLHMGAINGAFAVDVELTALERKGELRIISTPRVTTQNNKEAVITQGFEIPIQVVANNTVTVNFKDAALKLTVVPQITGANTVILQIALENGFPDFSRAVNGNPSINTQRAQTQVQVVDGVTTVIGGIMQSRESNATDRTPGISHIPLLGWLFRRDSSAAESQELLVFITPRIIRGLP
jgi:type IV pilus assembly protein PilQ